MRLMHIMPFEPIPCVFIVFGVVGVGLVVVDADAAAAVVAVVVAAAVVAAHTHNLSVIVFVRLACRLLLCAYRLCAENVFV